MLLIMQLKESILVYLICDFIIISSIFIATTVARNQHGGSNSRSGSSGSSSSIVGSNSGNSGSGGNILEKDKHGKQSTIKLFTLKIFIVFTYVNVHRYIQFTSTYKL